MSEMCSAIIIVWSFVSLFNYILYVQSLEIKDHASVRESNFMSLGKTRGKLTQSEVKNTVLKAVDYKNVTDWRSGVNVSNVADSECWVKCLLGPMGESALRYLIGAQNCVGEQSETAIEAQIAF